MSGCTGSSDTKHVTQAAVNDTPFDQTMRKADSLYNHMAFRDAYDLYLQQLNAREVQVDEEKRLDLLNSLCMTSELAGHKADQTKWLEQLIDLARQTGNDYYHSLGLLAMGKRIYGEGDKQLGIKYASDAIDLMSKTDREDTDHLTHSQMIILAGLYGDMKDYENALKTDERNVLQTQKGTRWGEWPQQAISPYLRVYCIGNFLKSLEISETSLNCFSLPDLNAPKYSSASVMSEILQLCVTTSLRRWITLGFFLINAIQTQVSRR